MNKIQELLENTRMTTSEISSMLEMNYPEIKKESGMTDVQLNARDTQITIYDVVGHDGQDPKDCCMRCGIILVYDLDKLPERWFKDQYTFGGNLCAHCDEIMLVKYRAQHQYLSSLSCYICGKESGVYYYQRGIVGTTEVYPWRAAPLCSIHKEKIYESEKAANDAIRDFHDALPGPIVRALLAQGQGG